MFDPGMLRAATVPIQHRLILELLSVGWMATERIPAVWPLERGEVADILSKLEAAGAVVRRWDPVVPGRQLAGITREGRRILGTMDDVAMRAAVAVALPGSSGD
jgi:DNA-binding HxlR family transcriptional regulator